MLLSKLFRVQLELQSHRIWLRTFTTRSIQPTRASTCDATETPHRRGDRRNYGVRTKRTYNAKRRPHTDSDHEITRHTSTIASLVEAVQQSRLDVAAQLYHDLQDKKVLHVAFVSNLLYSLDLALRRERHVVRDKDFVARLQKFAQDLAEDIRKGVLKAGSSVHVNLLNIFRDSQDWDAGAKYWTWLETHEDGDLTPAVCGAGIDLFALQDVKLADLEALYQQALEKHPESFVSYHFSHASVVSDRDRDVHGGNSLPMSLLRAIMVARLLRGDSKNAYLALDTALRLSPARLTVLFFKTFIEERPIAEAYNVFAIACRTGVSISSNVYRALLVRLRTDLDPRGLERMVFSLRAMLSATYLYIGAGGRVSSNAVSEILIGITSLTRTAEVRSLPVKRKREFANGLHGTIRETLELFVRMGVNPSMSAFNSIITNIGGFGYSKEAIDTALRSAEIIGLTPTIVTRRSILTAAGNLENVELIKDSWKTLVEERAALDLYPDATDLHILIKACKLAKQPELARAAVSEMQHLEEFQIENALERLESEENGFDPQNEQPTDDNTLFEQLGRLNADLAVLRQHVTEQHVEGLRDLSTQELPMTLVPPSADVQLPEPEMRALYDEMTTDPTAVKPEPVNEESAPAVSRTKIPLATLRYENWKSLTYLLSAADQHDHMYLKAVDKAIATGEKPPARPKGMLHQDHEMFGGVGLSDSRGDYGAWGLAEQAGEDQEGKRRRIRQLRNAVSSA